jgi:hypothetical protein
MGSVNPEERFGRLRAGALTAVAIGAVGALALMVRAGQRTPRFLLVLFTIWVLAPFVALGWANVISRRWSFVTRAALFGVTLVVAAGSAAIYGGSVIIAPAGSPHAFVFVIVPPVSFLLLAVIVPLAAWLSRKF